MLFQVYKALVESNLRYADVVWGSLSNTKISALQRLQNRAFEFIEASQIKNSLSQPTFSIDRTFQFDNKFAERSTISKYGTRNKTDRQIPRLNLDFSRKVLKTLD